MAYLLDSSILLRIANSADALNGIAARAVVELERQGHSLHITAQNLIEFRNAATRPVTVNGLGLEPSIAETQAAAFESAFSLLPETPDIYPAWKGIVAAAEVMGKQVHDARLVAVCHVYGVTHVLTFNTRHFARFAGVGPGVVIVDPADV